MQITLITGISGSGKSVALNVLEDAGYYCVDNLLPQLLPPLVEAMAHDGTPWLAVAIDARSADSLQELPGNIAALRRAGHTVQVIFLTASNDALVTRFSETRRSHPLSHRQQSTGEPPTLVECIAAERGLLMPLSELGHLIDTSGVRANTLRGWIRDFAALPGAGLTLLFESFGFKHGVPLDADLVFDVRVLPNPFYDPALRPQTGLDGPVAAFLDAQAEVGAMTMDIHDLIEKWLPAYKRDNRSYLTIAIGCTGGWHRSVFMAERLAQYFRAQETVIVRHREIDRARS